MPYPCFLKEENTEFALDLKKADRRQKPPRNSVFLHRSQTLFPDLRRILGPGGKKHSPHERPSTRRTLHTDVNQTTKSSRANAQPSAISIPAAAFFVNRPFFLGSPLLHSRFTSSFVVSLLLAGQSKQAPFSGYIFPARMGFCMGFYGEACFPRSRFSIKKLQKQNKSRSNLAIQAVNVGAAGRIRTADLILTKDALYLLSYSSIYGDQEGARTLDLQRDRLAF